MHLRLNPASSRWLTHLDSASKEWQIMKWIYHVYSHKLLYDSPILQNVVTAIYVANNAPVLFPSFPITPCSSLHDTSLTLSFYMMKNCQFEVGMCTFLSQNFRVSSWRPALHQMWLSLPSKLHQPLPNLYPAVCCSLWVSQREGDWWEKEQVCCCQPMHRWSVRYSWN